MTGRLAKKVLLIGWDAADWRVINPLIDAGKMPTLKSLIERGVMGNLATLHPVLSPMLWTSIATGKRPYKHGILGFSEPTPDGTRVRPVSSRSRKTKALWNILHQNGLKSHVIAWWPSAPVEPINGVMISNHYHQAVGPLDEPWPLPPGTVHPPQLAEEFAELRFHPLELTAEEILPFIPRATEIDQDKDKRLGMAMKTLAEASSVHAAATWAMENQPWDLMAVYYDAIDHFCHGFMKYHPPRRAHISEQDFELYKDVVQGGYRYHDMMLARLLELAGEDATIILVSDHGFHPDHNRPVAIPNEPAGPAVEHRDFGIFAMAGPGIKRDDLIYGASLLDVTPTILTLFGLPVGEDMDGKPLAQAFVTVPEIASIPSWDAVEGEAAMHPAEIQGDPLAEQAALQQLIALGYIDKLDDNYEQAVTGTAQELRYNLARAYMDGDHHAEAAKILEELYANTPDEHRFGVQLALCYRAMNWIRSLRVLVEKLYERRSEQARVAHEKLKEWNTKLAERKAEPNNADKPTAELLNEDERREWLRLRGEAAISTYDIEYLRGYVKMAERDYRGALVHLSAAEKAEPHRSGLYIQIGEAYLKLRRYIDAQRAFDKAAAIDPENPHVHLGLARSYLGRSQATRATEEAIRAVSLTYHFPLAHYVLGLALARLKRYDKAAEALEVAVAINPNFRQAHLRLVRLYTQRLDDLEKAAEHKRLVQAIRQATRRSRPRGITVPTAAPAVSAPLSTHLTVHRPPTGTDDQPFVTVVTGLPRTGTSMMMQMLIAGGLPILTDGQRAADADNPRGYYEYEPTTRLRTERDWVKEAVGQGVKIVAQLLPFLPSEHQYRVIFMRRDLDEVLASQRAMLERLGRETASMPPEQLRAVFQQQLRQIELWLAKQSNIQTLFVDYDGVLQESAATAKAVNTFIGGNLKVDAMAAAVDPILHRQRREASVNTDNTPSTQSKATATS
ncbi:MAG: alkaline phosphatase family protein [Candidatus Nitrosoglobus sp.]